MQLALAVVLGGTIVGVSLALAIYLQRRYVLARQLGFPLSVAACAAALKVVTLVQPGGFPALDDALSWLLIFLPAVVILRVAALYFFEFHLRTHGDVRFPPLIPTVIMGVIYLVTAFTTIKLVYPEANLGSLVAASAVTSLVLGLALQPILANFFAGVILSIEKPFRLNDWIKVGGTEGLVTAITWRTTHLRTRYNDALIVPNLRIGDEQVMNFAYPNPLHLEPIRVGVDYRVEPYRVRHALLQCTTVAGVLDHPSPDVYLLSFDDFSINYELRVWTDDYAEKDRICSEIRYRIWEQFKKDRITIPFPIRTLEFAPRRPVRGPADRVRARLFVADGAERGRSVELDQGKIVVGRSHACQLALDDAQASKEHFSIEWTPEGYVLADLNSSGGTLVNGRPAKHCVLRRFDRIGVGSTAIIFESDDA